MAIIAFILVLLNTYPVWVSQSLVFRYKLSSMTTLASLMTSALSGQDNMTSDSVNRVMEVIDDHNFRVAVCDETGKVLYDNSREYNAEGKFMVFPEIADAISGNDVFRSFYQGDAFKSRFAMPVISHGRITGAVYLYDYDPAQATNIRDLRANLSVVTIVVTAISIIVSIFLSMALTRRVISILQAIRAVRDGDYEYKADVHGRDELAQVAEQFNELSVILRKTESLRQQFVSDASHELKTPLASIRLLADSIIQTEDMDVATIREFVSDIGEEIDRLGRVTEKLMLLTRMESGGAEPEAHEFDPAKVLERAAYTLKPLAGKLGVNIRCEASKGLALWGDEDDFHEVVFNLMENAVKYNCTGGEVIVLCFLKEGQLIVKVSDTGFGIEEEDLSKIFDRFYRVDKARSRDAGGTGLGLSIVRHTVARLGGTVSVESTPGEGTSFTLAFPWRASDEK